MSWHEITIRLLVEVNEEAHDDPCDPYGPLSVAASAGFRAAVGALWGPHLAVIDGQVTSGPYEQ